MDKYMKLMAVKGLIMSMDEQLLLRFQKDNLPENVKTIVVNQYYDAILEQLEQSKDEKKKELIIALHKRGIISENVKNDLLYPKHENIGDETPEWAFNIIVNGRRHVIHTSDDKRIDWNEIVLLSELAKTGEEILTITYTGGAGDEPEGILEVNDLVKVKEGMIFNVCNTSKGEK